MYKLKERFEKSRAKDDNDDVCDQEVWHISKSLF